MSLITVAPSVVRQAGRPALHHSRSVPAAARLRVVQPGERAAGAPADVQSPLRLTRRGRLVMRFGVSLLAMLVVIGGVLLLNRTAEAGSTAHPLAVTYRVILPGETLWRIAGEVAPGVDRRETVARIVELNALSSAEVFSGQRIAVPGVGRAAGERHRA